MEYQEKIVAIKNKRTILNSGFAGLKGDEWVDTRKHNDVKASHQNDVVDACIELDKEEADTMTNLPKYLMIPINELDIKEGNWIWTPQGMLELIELLEKTYPEYEYHSLINKKKNEEFIIMKFV